MAAGSDGGEKTIEADPRLVDHTGRKRMRLAEYGAPVVYDLRKEFIGREVAIVGGIGYIERHDELTVSAAVAKHDGVAFREVVVQLDVALIVVIGVFRIQNIVVRQPGPIGQRIQRQVALHDGIELRGGYAIAGEGLARVSGGACRVVHGGQAGEIAPAHGGCGHREKAG